MLFLIFKCKNTYAYRLKSRAIDLIQENFTSFQVTFCYVFLTFLAHLTLSWWIRIRNVDFYFKYLDFHGF